MKNKKKEKKAKEIKTGSKEKRPKTISCDKTCGCAYCDWQTNVYD